MRPNGRVRDRLREEHGFTLVELMVVIINLAILMAIAIPTMTGALERVRDAAAKASLRTALTAGRIYFVTGGDYAAAALTDLTEVENSVLWVSESTISDEPKTVSRDVAGGVLTLATYSKGGTCFFVKDDPPNDLTYARLDNVTPADCSAGNAGAVSFSPTW